MKNSEIDFFRSIVENMNYGIYRTTPDGKILYVNTAFLEMIRCPSLDILKAHNLENETNELKFRAPDFKKRIEENGNVLNFESEWIRYDGTLIFVIESAWKIKDDSLNTFFYGGIVEDITDRKQAEEEKSMLIIQLQSAVSEVKTLSGLLPICSVCKKIRDDDGNWNQVETYINQHTEVEFSHGICPDCAKKLYPNYIV